MTINSDNMTVSNTDVINEFKRLYITFNSSEDDIKYYLNNSIDAAFINSDKKEAFKILLDKKIKGFYNIIRMVPH